MTPSIRSPHKNYLFELPHLGVIALEGEKTYEFLQGQLTCDLRTVTVERVTQGAQCNLKGRILALMDILYWEGLKLILPQNLVQATLNTLAKVALLSRISLSDDHSYRIFGFYLQNREDLLPFDNALPKERYALTFTKEGCTYHLGHGFYIALVDKNQASQLAQIFINKDQMLNALVWHSLRLKEGQFEIYPETRGLFLPHHLGLHQTPYISFNKGCYKGQEIIARMHYKATLKHALKIFEADLATPPILGEQFLDQGELVDYSSLGENRYLVAVSGPLQVNSEQNFT